MATLLVLLGAIGWLSYAGSHRSRSHRQSSVPALAPPRRAAVDVRAFLHRYVTADGRVVRWDQHADTVSEGQAYAMLMAVATGRRKELATVWLWDQTHLQRPDGLFSYQWKNGRVVGAQPAADADLDTAWALVLAGQRFGDPAYLMEGLRVASSILNQETAVVDGRIELLAGPWATTSPLVANPGYLAPQAMTALAVASGDPRWSELARDATALVDALVRGGGGGRALGGGGASLDARGPASSGGKAGKIGGILLPPDWVVLTANGTVLPVGLPNGTGRPSYGLDAQRSPVWLASSCSAGGRAVAAEEWSKLARAADHGARISYSLSGRELTDMVNPTGLVAAAAAASSAGHRATAAHLLDRADQQVHRHHTYYGDAWTALGRVLLDTNWLAACDGRGPG